MNMLTIPQVAKIMGITRQAVHKKVVKGIIPASKIGGRIESRKYTIKENNPRNCYRQLRM